MVLFQIDIVRFIQIYIIQLGMGILYLIYGLLILKRSTKRLNQIFSFFYISAASASIINVIYASLTIRWLVKVLHFVTVFLFCYAPLYLLVFCLIIYKSETVVTVKKNNIIAWSYFALLAILAPIAWLAGGITIDESTGWKPVWNLPFLLYALLLLSFYITIPLIYLLMKIYDEFEDVELKRRWLFFAIGVLDNLAILYLIFISNYVNDPTFRLTTSIAGLSLFASAILLYYGVVRQIKK